MGTRAAVRDALVPVPLAVLGEMQAPGDQAGLHVDHAHAGARRERLPGAGRPAQRRDLPRAHGDVDALHQRAGARADAEAAETDELAQRALTALVVSLAMSVTAATSPSPNASAWPVGMSSPIDVYPM